MLFGNSVDVHFGYVCLDGCYLPIGVARVRDLERISTLKNAFCSYLKTRFKQKYRPKYA